MTELTEIQVLYVKHSLQTKGLKYERLSEELLDHVCTDIEIQMNEENISFEKAFKLCCEAKFDESEIKKVQKNTYRLVNRKYIIMRNLTTSIGSLAAGFLVFVLFINATDVPSIKPFGESDKIRKSSSFGLRFHPILKVEKMHQGVDFAMPIGTPILASGDGVVLEVDHKKTGYGTFIKIKHDDSFVTSYAQLSKIEVVVGESVKKGTQIGLSGNSGSSTAPHLHYEVIKNGQHVDPALYMSEDLAK